MTIKLAAVNIHLSYQIEEDRILVSFDVTPGGEYAMALTRRLARILIGALAQLEANRKTQELGENTLLRDTVLGFEHSKAVAEGLASGQAVMGRRRRRAAAPPRLVREIKLTPRPDGGVVMALDDKQQVLTVDVTAPRVHSLIAGMLDLAANAEWNLPVIATWLDRAENEAPAAAATRVIH